MLLRASTVYWKMSGWMYTVLQQALHGDIIRVSQAQFSSLRRVGGFWKGVGGKERVKYQSSNEYLQKQFKLSQQSL